MNKVSSMEGRGFKPFSRALLFCLKVAVIPVALVGAIGLAVWCGLSEKRYMEWLGV